MQVLSAAEMQACDRATSEQFGMPSLELMRNAARAVASIARAQFPAARRVTVLCGLGNNGGDGMMAARLLAEAGLDVTTILLGSPSKIKGDAALAWQELSHSPNHTTHIVESPEQLASLDSALNSDLILDAILGTGFRPPMRGLVLAALEWIARSTAPVLAVDLPSGWPADATSATIDTPVFPADAVVTFTAPRPAHVFGQLTRRWNDPVVVALIGSPDEAIVSILNLHWSGVAHELITAPRPIDSNKGRFGHVLVVGGSVGKSGAPSMTSLAAMRVGAGLVTAAVPAPVLAQVSAIAPELMTHPLIATPSGQIAAGNLESDSLAANYLAPANFAPDPIAELTRGITVLAIGPGMGQSDDTAKFLTGLLAATSMPIVIDADALNLLAAAPAQIHTLSRGGERVIVLTPHPGEMARLAQTTTAAVQANRLGTARDFAQRHNLTLVLKGSRTLIAHPDGHVAVNTTGNPGMAKGGSGDVLTGLVAGVLAQFPHRPARAVEAAVYLHGLAADLAVRETDEHTLLATDSLHHLSRAFRFRSRGANGYVWLQGTACSSPREAVND